LTSCSSNCQKGNTLKRERADEKVKSYTFLICNLKAPFSVASSYGVLPAFSPCQLAGLDRALLSVALAMLTKGTPVVWTT